MSKKIDNMPELWDVLDTSCGQFGCDGNIAGRPCSGRFGPLPYLHGSRIRRHAEIDRLRRDLINHG
jgi:hypothetical protein